MCVGRLEAHCFITLLRRDTLVGGEADLTASLSQWVVYRAIAR